MTDPHDGAVIGCMIVVFVRGFSAPVLALELGAGTIPVVCGVGVSCGGVAVMLEGVVDVEGAAAVDPKVEVTSEELWTLVNRGCGQATVGMVVEARATGTAWPKVGGAIRTTKESNDTS